MRKLTNDEITYILNILEKETENIDKVMIFFDIFLTELQQQEEFKYKDFTWLKYLIEKLSSTSSNLSKISILYHDKK